MVLQELWDLICEEVFSEDPCEDDLFNQYVEEEPRVDLPGASRIRQSNLQSYMAAFSKKPPFLLVGEAAGPWGCRFSGVPFTGERQLLSHPDFPFPGRQSSRKDPPEVVLREKGHPPFTSQSAEAFWAVMMPYYHRPGFLVWDVVPFHPHDPGKLLSIRTPRAREIRKYSDILGEIIRLVDPRRVVAIGNKARDGLCRIGVDFVKVRHPARGGKEMFRAGIEQELSRLV